MWIRLPKHKRPKSWSSMEDPVVPSWTKSIWSSFGRTIMGKAIRESFYWDTVGKKFWNWEYLFVTPRKRTILVSVCGRFKNWLRWNKTLTQRGKYLLKEVDLGDPTSFFHHVFFGLHSRRECDNEQSYCRQLQKYVWIQNLRRSSKKGYLILGNLAQTFPLGPMIWNVMQRNVWSDIATWRTKQPSNCTKLVTNAWLVCFLSSHNWICAILSCGKHCTTMQAGTVSGPWLCRRSWRLNIDFRRNFVHIWKSYVCSFRLDVQETPLFRTVQRTLRLSLLMQVYAWMKFLLLIFGIWLLKCCLLLPTSVINPKRMCRETCCMAHHQEKHTKNQVKTPLQDNDLELCIVDDVSSTVKSSQFGAMLYIFEDNKAVLKMIIYGRSPTIRHVSRTHRVAPDWLFDRINPGPKNPKSNMLTPKTNSQTYWLRAISHVMNEIIFSICSISSCSVPQASPKRCRKECNKEHEKRELLHIRSRRWTWSRILRQALRQRRVRVHQVARDSEQPVSKVRIS